MYNACSQVLLQLYSQILVDTPNLDLRAQAAISAAEARAGATGPMDHSQLMTTGHLNF